MTYDVTKFRIYPWWKDGKRAEHYILVCYTESNANLRSYAKDLRKQGIKFNLKGKWFAQVAYHQDKKDKNLKGYALFCKKSITDPSMVAHELIHVTQFYFGYLIFPLCNTLMGQNHELIAHSHTFMMKRIMEFAKKLK